VRTTSTTSKLTRFHIAATLIGVAASAAAAAFLFAGVGTAQADHPCYGDLAYSYYCSPGASSPSPEPSGPFSGPPSPNLRNALPQCTGGARCVGS
jgi:hypothetical protein